MGRQRLDSINEFGRKGYAARVTCLACGNVSDWNAAELTMAARKARCSLSIEALERRMKCTACGQRQAAISPVPSDW